LVFLQALTITLRQLHQQNPSEVAAFAEKAINCADYTRLQPGDSQFRADAVAYNPRGKSLAGCNFSSTAAACTRVQLEHHAHFTPDLASSTPP
jgi:hypothetical protein